jgi:hypothetical protein
MADLFVGPATAAPFIPGRGVLSISNLSGSPLPDIVCKWVMA